MTESERLRQLERRLWQAADQLRANSQLRAADYSIPVLGLIFLRPSRTIGCSINVASGAGDQWPCARPIKAYRTPEVGRRVLPQTHRVDRRGGERSSSRRPRAGRSW